MHHLFRAIPCGSRCDGMYIHSFFIHAVSLRPSSVSESAQPNPAQLSSAQLNDTSHPVHMGESNHLHSACLHLQCVFQVGNANPNNERAQARVYALWTFAKAYVADKDRVAIDGGKGAEIKVSQYAPRHDGTVSTVAV